MKSFPVYSKNYQVNKITENTVCFKRMLSDTHTWIKMIQCTHEGSIQGISPSSWLPALPSRLMGQLETHQASQLLHGALTLAMKFLMKSHMFPDAAQEAEVGGGLEMQFMLGSAQLLTGDLGESKVGCC